MSGSTKTRHALYDGNFDDATLLEVLFERPVLDAIPIKVGDYEVTRVFTEGSAESHIVIKGYDFQDIVNRLGMSSIPTIGQVVECLLTGMPDEEDESDQSLLETAAERVSTLDMSKVISLEDMEAKFQVAPEDCSQKALEEMYPDGNIPQRHFSMRHYDPSVNEK